MELGKASRVREFGWPPSKDTNLAMITPELLEVDGLGLPRPPCLLPRQRFLSAVTRRALEAWGARQLRVRGHLHVEEWVSMDSRTRPHRVRFLWLEGSAWRTATYFEKSEDLLRGDAQAAVSPS